MRAVLGLVVALALAPGCKGDSKKCEQAARNYATLTYWAKTEPKIAALPEDQRDAFRKKKLAEFTNELETEIDFFVKQCVSANNDDQVDCMIEAKTAEQVAKCADLVNSD